MSIKFGFDRAEPEGNRYAVLVFCDGEDAIHSTFSLNSVDEVDDLIDYIESAIVPVLPSHIESEDADEY